MALVMLVSGAATLLPSATFADTIYDFSPTATLGSSGQAIGPFTLQLDLYDDFTPGSFSRDCAYGMCAGSGSFSDFSLTATFNGYLLDTLDSRADYFEDTYGTFDGSSGTLFWAAESDITLSLTFGDGVWNAAFNSDFAPLGLGAGYCDGDGCTATGTVAQVPEPAALGLFAAGLAALAAMLKVGGRARAERRSVAG
jgi:hypothetical protein